MPNSIPYYCSYPGCNRVAEQGTRCTEHRRKAGGTHKLTRTQRGYSNRWLRLRKRWIRAHPKCNHCGRLADEVDHIIPHRGDAKLLFDSSNLQSLCKRCHAAKTVKERQTDRGKKRNG
jgi:5-methylcytosine-specific restriction protein A